MADRALVAYERSDGQFNLHYSHTGGRALRLKQAITGATPLGSDTGPQWAREALTALRNGASVEAVTEQFHLTNGNDDLTPVRPIPVATGVDFETAISDRLNYLDYVAFYVVDRDFLVTAYRPLWFGFEYQATSVDSSPVTGHGALLRLRWVDGEPVDDAYYRGRFAGMKHIVADMLDREIFDREEAWEYLRRHLIDAIGDPTLLQVRLQE